MMLNEDTLAIDGASSGTLIYEHWLIKKVVQVIENRALVDLCKNWVH